MSQVMGMDELLRNLNTLPEKVQKRVLVGAVRAAAKPIVQEAKSLVPVKYGSLKRSIGVTRFRTHKRTLVWFQVSPRVKKYRLQAQDTSTHENVTLTMEHSPFYGQFIEFGTYSKLDHALLRPSDGERAVKRAAIVAKGGGIRPHPFMRPAFEREGHKAIIALKDYMAQRLDRELAR